MNTRKSRIKSKICLNCNSEFNILDTLRGNNRKYCSKNCVYLSKLRNSAISKRQKGIPEKDWVKIQKSILTKNRWDGYSLEKREKMILNGIGSIKARFKARQSSIGRKCPNTKYKRGFIRNDLQQYFRSSWEANFARILNYCGIKFEYEQKRFIFAESSYLPDFYLPEKETYIEVKGYWKNGFEKLTQMHKSNPNISLKILDYEAYLELQKKFSDKIPTWEFKTRRLYNAR